MSRCVSNGFERGREEWHRLKHFAEHNLLATIYVSIELIADIIFERHRYEVRKGAIVWRGTGGLEVSDPRSFLDLWSWCSGVQIPTVHDMWTKCVFQSFLPAGMLASIADAVGVPVKREQRLSVLPVLQEYPLRALRLLEAPQSVLWVRSRCH